MAKFYVAQYYNDSEEQWEDCWSSPENDKNLKEEALWAATSKTFSGKWRIIKRSQKIIETGQV